MSLPYHRLARTHRLGKYTPWHPFIELILLTAFSFALMLAFILVVGFALVAVDYPLPLRGTFEELDESDPAMKFLLYGSLAAMIPAPFLAARITGRRPRALWSVDNRFRWGLFGRAALVVATFHIVTSLLDAVFASTGTFLPDFDERSLIILLIVAAYTPLQCAAEEIIYRGALPQIVGAWIRKPWLAYLLPIPFFVLAHDYDPAGLFFVAIFAVFASILVHRTGGLEVAIAFHAGNNMSVEWYALMGIDADIRERPSLIFISELSTWVLFAILLIVFWNFSPPAREPAPARPQPGVHYPAVAPPPYPPHPALQGHVPPHQMPQPQHPQQPVQQPLQYPPSRNPLPVQYQQPQYPPPAQYPPVPPYYR